MATVAADKVGTGATALVASTVETVTFTDALTTVGVISDGTSAVWWTSDGSVPTVGGAGCWYIPALPMEDVRPVSGKVIKLISAGTPTVRVQKES